MSDDVEAAKQPKQKKSQHHSSNNKHMSQSGDHQLVRQNSDSKTMLAQQAPGDVDKPKSSCSKGFWIFVGLMTLVSLILAALLIAIFGVLDKRSPCSDNPSLPPQSYNLFSTKTAYRTAYGYLNSGSAQVPSIFSQESLEALDKRLQGDGCRARQLHYYGRHAARYPNLKSIERITQGIKRIQEKIDLTTFSQDDNSNIKEANDITGNATTTCSDPMQSYKHWSNFFNPNLDDLVTESGAKETTDIIRRLMKIYPELFDQEQSNLNISTSDKVRTAQTAYVFMKEMNYQPPGTCRLEDYTDLFNRDNVDNIRIDNCLRDLMDKRRWADLTFYEECNSPSPKKAIVNITLNLDQSKQRLISAVSKRLKRTDNNPLTVEDIDVMYEICRYETAINNSSIWCQLFSTDDLTFLEYVKDIEDFYTNAYGDDFQYKSACPLTVPLWLKLQSIYKNPSSRPNLEANFHFTHNEAIQRLLAAVVDLSQDSALSKSTVEDHLRNGEAPARDWRTSLLSPFSSNLAFTLYECQVPASSTNGATVMNVDSRRLRVVASLNERPIMMTGCSKYDCDLEHFHGQARFFDVKPYNCNLKRLCTKRVVID